MWQEEGSKIFSFLSFLFFYLFYFVFSLKEELQLPMNKISGSIKRVDNPCGIISQLISSIYSRCFFTNELPQKKTKGLNIKNCEVMNFKVSDKWILWGRIHLMLRVVFLKVVEDEAFTCLVCFCHQVHLHIKWKDWNKPFKLINVSWFTN